MIFDRPTTGRARQYVMCAEGKEVRGFISKESLLIPVGSHALIGCGHTDVLMILPQSQF